MKGKNFSFYVKLLKMTNFILDQNGVVSLVMQSC